MDDFLIETFILHGISQLAMFDYPRVFAFWTILDIKLRETMLPPPHRPLACLEPDDYSVAEGQKLLTSKAWEFA